MHLEGNSRDCLASSRMALHPPKLPGKNLRSSYCNILVARVYK